MHQPVEPPLALDYDGSVLGEDALILEILADWCSRFMPVNPCDCLHILTTWSSGPFLTTSSIGGCAFIKSISLPWKIRKEASFIYVENTRLYDTFWKQHRRQRVCASENKSDIWANTVAATWQFWLPLAVFLGFSAKLEIWLKTKCGLSTRHTKTILSLLLYH